MSSPPGRARPGGVGRGGGRAPGGGQGRRGNAAGALPGDRRAAGIGSGLELAQLRPYEVGDDVRQIDAAATARTGTPRAPPEGPQRTLTTWIRADVPPRVGFGPAARQ